MQGQVHNRITDELLDMLALHAFGLLDADDAAMVEQHLSEGCELCGLELYKLRQTVAAIGLSTPEAAPPPHLRAKLLSGISRGEMPGAGSNLSDREAQVWKAWVPPQAAGQIQVVRTNEGEWQEVRAGVWAKQLHVDPERDQATMLIRMNAGSSYIPHRHCGLEQCYVLDGDLREGDLVMHAGDFQCASEGSAHGAQWTQSGCLLLIVSCLRDELLI